MIMLSLPVMEANICSHIYYYVVLVVYLVVELIVYTAMLTVVRHRADALDLDISNNQIALYHTLYTCYTTFLQLLYLQCSAHVRMLDACARCTSVYMPRSDLSGNH
jgi:hypothetical protein